MTDLQKKANDIRRIVLEATFRAGSGHIGGDLSVCDILTVLYHKIMNVSPERIHDPDRDRFLLSKAHCADCLYTVLGDMGYFDLSEYLNTFEKFQSRFIGHTNTMVPGIEFNGGSLGHGLSVGVGMALAAKMDGRNYRTYVVLGDGEMEEGSNYEAMMAAAQFGLDNLCATVDCNGLQISGRTCDVMNTAPLGEKFSAFGWNVIEVPDGNDCAQLVSAYEAAKTYEGKPTAVIAHTVKGEGVSFMENNARWHHGVMTREQYEQAVSEVMKGRRYE